MIRYALKYLPIDEMHVSKLNMRHGRKPPNTDDIYPSVLKSGVLKPMLVRREGETWGVVAGRRRLFALRRKEKETGKRQQAPCVIMQPDDDAAAVEASIIENVGVERPTEMQQYEAFARLAKKGRSVAEIADYFGVDERDVKRILALANLTAGIRKLYAAEEIDAATIRALTLATKAQQEEWLRLYRDDDGHAPMGHQARAWLAGGAAITTDKALFDLDRYEGEIANDLFGECGVFASADQFWAAQSRAVADLADRYRRNGWSEVVILTRGERFVSWEYGRRTKAERGKVFIETRHDGTVKAHEGYLLSADIKRIDRILNNDKDAAAPAAIKPEMSGPMAEYVALHRHAAARAALIDRPGVALRLAVAHLIVGSPLWRVEREPQRARQSTAESLASSDAEERFAAERAAVCNLLHIESADAGLVRQNNDPWRLAALFAKLLTLSDAEVLRTLAVAMGETLEAGSSAVEAVAFVTGADIAGLWKPDEAFFELLRDRRAAGAMLADIAGERAAKSLATATLKTQKSAIANRIRGVGAEPRPDWRPKWMAVPPERLVDGAASLPADQWERIADLFAPREDDSGPAEIPSGSLAA